MAASPFSGPGIFAQLKEKGNAVVEQAKEDVAALKTKEHTDAQSDHVAKLLDSQSTLPVTVNNVRVNGAYHTRPGFLARALSPLLVKDKQWTLQELIKESLVGSEHLNRFDIFHEPISVFFDRPDSTDPNSTATDLDIFFTALEKNRLTLQSGTEVGNAEGNAYANAQWKNIFGGAEAAGVSATFGTRTRSAYSAYAKTPIAANPNLWLEAAGALSTVDKPWASHQQISRGGHTQIRYLTKGGHNHEFRYGWDWRTITGLAAEASPSVRHEAGHSVKSSISHTWTVDTRNYPALATSGVYAKVVNELAGAGALGGNVAFWKSETETQLSVPLGPLGERGWSFTLGGRTGLLYPLSLGNSGKVRSSRLPDRFQLGGPSDVRGFRISGMGPRDSQDALGGDVFAAGSANLLFPLPRVSAAQPFRGQLFLTGGRLLALGGDANNTGSGAAAQDVRSSVYDAVKRVGTEMPSVAVGLGLVYAHPVARFELNFSLPLVVRRGEQSRKGLSFGVGINML